MNAITNNDLRVDLDAPYDKSNNKIDVYSSVYWTADNKAEYNRKEKLIHDYKVDNDLFDLFAWCDISGYDYWVIQQEEENYVSIDVVLKKDVELYTDEEIEQIREAIIVADDYFSYQL